MHSPVEEFIIDFCRVSSPSDETCFPERRYHDCRVVFLKPRNYRVVYLEMIVADTPKCGSGTKAMRGICKLANHHGVQIWLEAKPLRVEWSEGDLIKWYERFGFEKLDFSEKRALGGFQDMIRKVS